MLNQLFTSLHMVSFLDLQKVCEAPLLLKLLVDSEIKTKTKTTASSPLKGKNAFVSAMGDKPTFTEHVPTAAVINKKYWFLQTSAGHIIS